MLLRALTLRWRNAPIVVCEAALSMAALAGLAFAWASVWVYGDEEPAT